MKRTAVSVLLAVMTVARGAAADDAVAVNLLERPHTVASLEAGVLILPTAAISPSNRGGNTPFGRVGTGDATLMAGLRVLYRAGPDWAVGANAMFAPTPTSDKNYSGQQSLSRTHSRSYLVMGGEARIFPVRYRWFEGWLGLDAAAVFVADRYDTAEIPPVPPLVGINEVTVRTGGVSLGIGIGGDYVLSESFTLGLGIHADRWLLPNLKAAAQNGACDGVGDCPTLGGTVAAFQLGLTMGYRIPL